MGWERVFAIAPERPFHPRTLYDVAGVFSGGSPAGFITRAIASAGAREARALVRRLGLGAGRRLGSVSLLPVSRDLLQPGTPHPILRSAARSSPRGS